MKFGKRYLINPGNTICGGDSSPTLLALVVTAPGNFERRSLIRKTWANKKYSYMKVVFMMGDSSNQIVNEQVVKESERFKDIVQESFHDTYENLTLKSVLIFKWSAEYCPLAKAFMKVDDDVYVHTYKLGQYLNSALVQEKGGGLNGPLLRNTFMCKVHRNAPADRNSTNKWYVSYEEYRFDIFVTYCGGKPVFFWEIFSVLFITFRTFSKLSWKNLKPNRSNSTVVQRKLLWAIFGAT